MSLHVHKSKADRSHQFAGCKPLRMTFYDKAETISIHSRSSMTQSFKGEDFEDIHLDDVYPRKLPKSASTPFLGRQVEGSRKITPSTMYSLPVTSMDYLYSGYREGRRGSTGGSQFKLHRKTIKELEQEYDDDDEVPEDTIFYNVPLSPMKTRSQCSRSYHRALGPETKEISARIAAQTFHPITHYRVEKGQSFPPKPSEIVIDPMPMSKEKRQILSKTRPSWLPPKSKREDQKHLAEYERMMKKAVQAEKEKKEREIAERMERERALAETAKLWEKNLLPNWDKVYISLWLLEINQSIDDHGVRDLWWSGLPPLVRGQIWGKAIGNALALSPNTFQIALDRAKQCKARNSGQSQAMFEHISRDVDVTFPGLRVFQTSLRQDLTDLLMAYSFYRKDIGYVSGAHLIAAVLLLNIPRQFAFIALANILNRPIPLALMTRDTLAVLANCTLLTSRLKKCPKLYSHLHIALEFPVGLYLEPILLPLFAAHVPLAIILRLYDIYFFEGDRFLLRALLATILKMEALLYGDETDVLKILQCKPRPWDLGKEDDFIQLVRTVGRD